MFMKKTVSLPLEGQMPSPPAACGSSGLKAETGGYLAVYPALYEPDMGVDYARPVIFNYEGFPVCNFGAMMLVAIWNNNI